MTKPTTPIQGHTNGVPVAGAEAKLSGLQILLIILFFASGACGLIYEIVWSRLLLLVMGATTFAISTVLTAFMAGLALGAYLGGLLAPRLRRPATAYGLLEIGIGLYALLLPWLLSLAVPLYRWLYAASESSFLLLTVVRFVVCIVLLLIPTTLMGATLPVITQYLAARTGAVGRPVAILYGVNALGAACGVIFAGFVLLPWLGFATTTLIAACVNLLVGAIVLGTFRQSTSSGVRPITQASGRGGYGLAPYRLRLLVMSAFAVSGFCAMVYQVCWTRALITVVGGHTYAFSCILGAFILGLSVGSMLMSRWVDRLRRPVLVFGLCELVLGCSAAVVVPLLGLMPDVVRGLMERFGHSFSTLRWVEFALIIALVLVPTLIMGAIMPLIARLLARGIGDAGGAVGRAYAVNTIGTILGASATGFILIPVLLGVRLSILLAVILNILVGLTLLSSALKRTLWRVLPWPAGVAAAVVAGPVLARPWDTAQFARANFRAREPVAEPMDVLYYREGIDATVSVTARRGIRTLRVNSKPDASDHAADCQTQVLLGHVPALLCPSPEKVLVIGLGSGMTTSAVACHPEVQRIDSVEISPAVLEAATLFSAKNYDILNNSRVRHIRADGRNHLLLTTQMYDLIVSEPSDPWLAGIGSLFTHEFFELCRARLEPDGLLAIWMATYALSPDAFPRIVATLHDVLPYVSVWETSSENYCLIASARRPELSLVQLEQRFANPWVRADLNRIGIRDLATLLGTFVADQDSLRNRLPRGGFHTDDNAFLEFTSPAYAWAGGGDVTHTKEWLLDALATPFGQMIRTNPSDQHHRNIVEQTRAQQAAMRLRWETHIALRALQFSEAVAQMNEALDLAPENVRAVSTAVELHQFLRQWIEPGPDGRFPEWMSRGWHRVQQSLTPEMRDLCFGPIPDSQLGLPGS